MCIALSIESSSIVAVVVKAAAAAACCAAVLKGSSPDFVVLGVELLVVGDEVRCVGDDGASGVLGSPLLLILS
jgi:hypothetical protein